MERTPQQVCDDLIVLLNRTKSVAVELAEEQGITRVQFFALYSIYHSEELAMGQVADVLHCDASNITGIVERMVTQGLITRKESIRDRRTKMLVLTAKGRQIIEALTAAMPAKLHCDKLDANERAILHTIIRKIC